jgi:phage regulator Rha-like protein
MSDLVPIERIETKILLIRGQKVMLDRDLAALYQVSTKVLNQAVRRNIERFPDDFRFQISCEEAEALRSQFVTTNLKSQNATSNRGGRRYLPYAFTEQGIAMLSSVLNSKRAIQVNIAIMRAFVKLRQILATHKDLREKIEAMESKYDKQFAVVFDAIKRMIEEPVKEKSRIGFLKERSGDEP